MAELNGAPAQSDDLQALALTNYGHFTSMRVDDGCVRGLSLHVERLVRDCRIVFGADLSPERVREFICRAVSTKHGSFVVRVTVFDPAVNLGHPGARATPHVLVTTRAAVPAEQPPLRVASRRFVRDLPAVKHTGLFGSLYHRRAAQLDGYDDALFTDGSGAISEGPTWNIGFYDGHDVVWPKAEVLPGVTMTLVRQAHARAHVTAPVTVDLSGVQAAFATNTSVGVRPISVIDGIELDAKHPILDELRSAYRSIPGESLE